jgi:ankyrin repeat protein
MEIRAKSEDDRQWLVAASNGDLGVLRKATHRILRTAVCTSGCSALHWAAGSNQQATVEYLVLERGIPVDLPAVKKSRGRTALHYACRNGHLETVRWLVETGGANPDARAKHAVSPFQLAVWQNRFEICQWLVEDCHVDPSQLNDFACGAVHWIGLYPRKEDEESVDLIPMATWLDSQPGVTFRLTQRQGHSPLHKAAWGGHLSLIQYLHQHQDLWDDSQDDAGNFAADLADMANTPRHAEIAKYLRNHCSRARAESCAILGVPVSATDCDIRKAYLKRARELHPDRNGEIPSAESLATTSNSDHEFDALNKAYRHLVDEGGKGSQSNPAHSLKLMLQHVSATNKSNTSISENEPVDESPASLFKARLIAVLLEYGDKGLDLSNVKKKWRQVWPDEAFPEYVNNKRRSLSEFLVAEAGDAIYLRKDENDVLRVFSRHHTQKSVAKDVQTTTVPSMN